MENSISLLHEVSLELTWGGLIVVIVMINLANRVTFRNGAFVLLQLLLTAPLHLTSPRGGTAAGRVIFYPQS